MKVIFINNLIYNIIIVILFRYYANIMYIMKIINDNHAYINSLMLVLILIPIFLIIIFTVSLSFTITNDSAGDLSANLLKDTTCDVDCQLNIISKQAMHNLSSHTLENRQAVGNSTKTLKEMIQSGVDNLCDDYYDRGILINCTIVNVYPSDDPFSFEVYYRINSTFINDSTRNIQSENKISVSLVDGKYPVYDVYPSFMGNVNVVNDSYRYHDVDAVYDNATSGLIIKKCPYEQYTKHAHSNITMTDCLNNHYYHFSHDGLCVFCRLENRSTCAHNGLETFIIPSVRVNESTSSVDHVYFNTSLGGHYNGSLRDFNDSFIYLDDAHGGKYGFN